MNDESQNPFFDSQLEPQLAARIVALVLGEASDFERDELNQLIAKRPELAVFKSEIENLHGMMTEVGSGEPLAPDEQWNLPNERRKKVLAVINGEAEVEDDKSLPVQLLQTSMLSKRSWLWNLSKIAAVFLAGGFLVSMALPRMSAVRTADSMSKVASVEKETQYLEGDIGNEIIAGFRPQSNQNSAQKGQWDDSGVWLENGMTSTLSASDGESNAVEDSTSALSDLRSSLAMGSSPTYADDDVRFDFAESRFGAPSKAKMPNLPRWESEGQRDKNWGVPVPSQEPSDDIAAGTRRANERSERFYEEAEIAQTPFDPAGSEPARPKLSLPTVETAPAQRSVRVPSIGTMLFGGVKEEQRGQYGAGVSPGSSNGLASSDGEEKSGVIGDANIQFVPELGQIIIRGTKRDVDRIKATHRRP